MFDMFNFKLKTKILMKKHWAYSEIVVLSKGIMEV
jgi:hypothetical protein